jgi:hypothetical protein
VQDGHIQLQVSFASIVGLFCSFASIIGLFCLYSRSLLPL